MKLKTILLALLFTLGHAAVSTLYAQTAPKSIFQQLTGNGNITLTISTDVSALIENKNTAEYFPATLSGGDGKSYKMEVKPRGKFRRRIAPIPPLKLKFKKKMLQAEGLDTLNEIKLVLPCFLDGKGDELIIREYIAYRLFEQISPASVRARLVDLTLINTGTGNAAQYRVKAILLEDEEELAARLQGEVVDAFGLTIDKFEPRQAASTVVFQYMIGNTDWSILENRNVRFIRNKAGELLLVPFDFDFSGLVNASYATPSGESGLRNVRERFLMDQGLSQPALDEAVRTIQAHREAFYTFCSANAGLASISDSLIAYLDTFFRQVEKDGKSLPKSGK